MITKTEIQHPKEDKQNQYPAYALKSDDGKPNTNILLSMLPITAMMKKNRDLFFKKTTRSSNYPIAYAANHSDDGEKLKH